MLRSALAVGRVPLKIIPQGFRFSDSNRFSESPSLRFYSHVQNVTSLLSTWGSRVFFVPPPPFAMLGPWLLVLRWSIFLCSSTALRALPNNIARGEGGRDQYGHKTVSREKGSYILHVDVCCVLWAMSPIQQNETNISKTSPAHVTPTTSTHPEPRHRCKENALGHERHNAPLLQRTEP